MEEGADVTAGPRHKLVPTGQRESALMLYNVRAFTFHPVSEKVKPVKILILKEKIYFLHFYLVIFVSFSKQKIHRKFYTKY